MTAQKGAAFLLKIGNGGAPETFTTLGGLRLTRFILDQQAVESTHRESGAWRALLAQAGTRAVSISGAGIFTDAASEETARNYAFTGTIANYELAFGSNDKLSGPFLITRYERGGDHDAEEVYELTLESAGAVTFTGG